MANPEQPARSVSRSIRLGNVNTFFFCKENIAIVLVFAVFGGAVNATLKMQDMGTFQFMPIIVNAVKGGLVTLVVVMSIVWLWNCIAAWREQQKE